MVYANFHDMMFPTVFIYLKRGTSQVIYSAEFVLSFYLRQLFSYVSTDKYSFKIDPQILNRHPAFNNVSGGRELSNPLVDALFKRCVISVGMRRLDSRLRDAHGWYVGGGLSRILVLTIAGWSQTTFSHYVGEISLSKSFAPTIIYL